MIYSNAKPTVSHALAGLLAGTALTFPAVAFAQTEVVWDGSEGTDPDDAANWVGEIAPSAANTAVVALDGLTDANIPTLNDGQLLSLRNLIVGRGQDGRIIINRGGRVAIGSASNTGNLEIGLTTSPFGVINSSTGRVEVSGGRLDVSGTINAGNGFQSSGVLSITNAGNVFAQALCIGCGNPNFAGSGRIEIDGQGSILAITTATGFRAIGTNTANGGQGSLSITNGGALQQIDSSTTGWTIGAGSDLRVRGTGSRFVVPAPISVSGTFSVLANATARVGSLDMSGEGRLEVGGGSQLLQLAGNVQNWTFGQQAGVIIAGENSLMDVNGAISIGASNVGLATANFRIDGGTVQVRSAGPSNIGGGEQRSMIINSGGQLIMAGGFNMGNATLTVIDSSATLGGDLLMTGFFEGNRLNLVNSDFTASSIVAGSNSVHGASIITVGSRSGESAGAAGQFNVGSINLGGGAGGQTEFVLNHNNTGYVIATNFIGSGIIRHLAGNTIFTGGADASGSFVGQTFVSGGTLSVNDQLGGNGHTVLASGSATLGGSGRIGGNVTIADATLAAGNSVGTLTFVNNLVLSANSILEFELGAPGGSPGLDSDLISVLGNLTLDGTLNITNVGGFGAGLYRLFDYGGTLTDNGLEFGGVPMGFTAEDLAIQTSVARQVNLVVAAPPPELGSFSFWDGVNLTANDTIDGGTGTWSAVGSNWTDSTGATNGAYDPDTLLIFAGTGGRVTIDEPGGIAVNNGLQFASDGYVIGGDRIALGDGPVMIRIGDGTMEGANYTAIIESDIGGAGSIEKTDLGGLILTGDVAAAGGTTITNGTLQIGNGGNTGSISGDIANFGTLVFNRAGEVSYGNVISGTGGLIQRGPGVLTLASNHTFNGGTRIEGGTLSNLGTLASVTAISAGGTLNNRGRVGAIANDGTITNFGVIGGTVINNAPATLISTGTIDGAVSNFGTAQLGGNINGVFANQAGGEVTITAPTTFVDFQQGAGGSFDLADQTAQMNGLSGDGTFALGTGTLTISPPAAIGSNQFNGQITGAGALVIDGEGALFLGGDNSYTGGTDVRAGELRGDTGSLQGTITVNEGGLLGFQQVDDGKFAGTLAGNGLISTSGLGQLVINGENSFTGTLSSSGRELQINGNLGQATVQMLATGGTLSGTGTAGAIRIFAGNAIIAPGAAPRQVGTFNVLGNFNDLGVDFIYDADVGPMAADRITVGGTANLAGTLVINAAPGSYRFGSYVLLSAAGGRTGEFGTVTGLSDFGAAFRPTVYYSATEVVLRIDPNAIADVLGDTPLTFNQRSAVTRFDAAITSGLTDPNAFIAFYDLPVTAIPAAFDALSGEVHASAARLVLDDERMVRRATLDQLAATTGTEGGNAWIGALGRFGNVDSDGNAAKITRDSIGIIIGADIGDASGDEGQGWRAGVQGHYLRTSFAIDDRASSGTIDRFGGGVYGALRTGGFGVKLGATIASVDLATTRSIIVPGFSETAASDVSGTAFQGYGEVNYRIEAGSVTLEPFAGIGHTRFDIGTVAESGQLAAVSVAARDDRLTVADAGLRGMATVKTGETGRIDLRAALGVRQVLGDRDLTADLAFVSVPTVGFAVATIAQDRTAFAPEIGIDAQLGSGLSLGLSYEGVIGETASDHGVRAALRLAF